MNNDAQVAIELAKTLESFVQQQSILIQKLVGVTHESTSVAVRPAINVPNEGVGQFDKMTDAQINKEEEEFGEAWDEESLAKHFGEKVTPRPNKQKTLREMSKSEIDVLPLDQLNVLVQLAEKEETEMDNSTDIYKIKARVANLARDSGGNLTAQGEILCNTYVHVLKSLYDFADTISDSNIKIKLRKLLRNHENLPGLIISAANVGIMRKK